MSFAASLAQGLAMGGPEALLAFQQARKQARDDREEKMRASQLMDLRLADNARANEDMDLRRRDLAAREKARQYEIDANGYKDLESRLLTPEFRETLTPDQERGALTLQQESAKKLGYAPWTDLPPILDSYYEKKLSGFMASEAKNTDEGRVDRTQAFVQSGGPRFAAWVQQKYPGAAATPATPGVSAAQLGQGEATGVSAMLGALGVPPGFMSAAPAAVAGSSLASGLPSTIVPSTEGRPAQSTASQLAGAVPTLQTDEYKFASLKQRQDLFNRSTELKRDQSDAKSLGEWQTAHAKRVAHLESLIAGGVSYLDPQTQAYYLAELENAKREQPPASLGGAVTVTPTHAANLPSSVTRPITSAEQSKIDQRPVKATGRLTPDQVLRQIREEEQTISKLTVARRQLFVHGTKNRPENYNTLKNPDMPADLKRQYADLSRQMDEHTATLKELKGQQSGGGSSSGGSVTFHGQTYTGANARKITHLRKTMSDDQIYRKYWR